MKLTTSNPAGNPAAGIAGAHRAADQRRVATAVSFAGGSVWNADYSGWNLRVVSAGRRGPGLGIAVQRSQESGKETAYLVWVSEFTVQMLPADPPFCRRPRHPPKRRPMRTCWRPVEPAHLLPDGPLEAHLAQTTA